jgi:translocator protein
MGVLKAAAGLVAAVGVCLAVGWWGSQFEPGTWYAGLRKPPITPPRWVFPVVWTALYVAMAVAAWWVWLRVPLRRAWPALMVFGGQLALNGLWSWVFFGQQEIGWALVELVALWGAVLAATLLFWRLTTAAGVLMLPYLAWTTYAGVLNLWFWWLNG